MLQKILVAFVSVIMMVVGAVTPAFDGSSQDGAEMEDVDVSATVNERVTTRGYAANHDFARLSVLKLQVDGRPVLEDAKGQGYIETLRFTVGVKEAEGNTLLIGDDPLTLKPTDEITIRGFNGRFEFKNTQTALATLALDGHVTRTLINEGDDVKQVRTESAPRLDDRALGDDDPASNLPYVVLDGEPVQTVSVNRGGVQRLQTEPRADDATSDDARDGATKATALLAKWVKINGKLVNQYTWGDGALDRVEFVPAEASNGGSVHWNGDELQIKRNVKIVVTDFLGTYRVSQVRGGAVHLELDGYAGNVTHLVQAVGDAAGGSDNVPPEANFTVTPREATTSDTLRFTDLSEDPDGVIVYREWDFGDGSTTVLENPRHRYATPGTYPVTLKVTDNNLAVTTYRQMVQVDSTPPVADWDYNPDRPTSIDGVQFIDQSWDSDGTITQYQWEFGDGSTSTEANPVHEFPDDGNYTITLTVTDDHGLTHKHTRIVHVENAAPEPRFNHDPKVPVSRTTVNFNDESVDPDGDVVAWEWNFGDGFASHQRNPSHAFTKSGTFEVALTTTDDDGAQSTFTSQVTVENRAPSANFSWSPPTVNTTSTVYFNDLSVDLDGDIVSWEWDFGDGVKSTQRHPVHEYDEEGDYTVCLTVRDDYQQTGLVCKTLGVNNSPPIADFTWPDNPIPFALDEIPFTDLSYDPDGDAITSWRWDFGHDGQTSRDQNPTHIFPDDGNFPVTLTVIDARGNVASITRTVQVLNNLPQASFTLDPNLPRAEEQVELTADAMDVDGTIVGYEWRFGDGGGLVCDLSGCESTGSAEQGNEGTGGDVVYHTWAGAATYTVTLIVTDDDGARTSTSRTVDVGRAVADADFTWTPTVPNAGHLTRFEGTAEGGDRPIVRWEWTFVGVQTNTTQNANVAFPNSQTYEVRLRIVDDMGSEDTEIKHIYVNAPPNARFSVDNPTPAINTPVRFTDQSTDKEDAIRHWRWEFGDGATSSEQNPTHSWATPGPKLVTLTVTDDNGAQSTARMTLQVDNLPPSATFRVSPANPRATAPTLFESISSDPDPGDLPAAWQWDFGDGNTSTTQHPSHVYAESGFYLVRHRVSDGDAWSPWVQKEIRVTSPNGVCYTVKGILPDGRFVDFGKSMMDLDVRLYRVNAANLAFDLEDASVTLEGHARICLASGSWTQGDMVDFNIIVGNTHGETVRRYLDRDNVPDAEVVVGVPARLIPTISVDPGDEESPVLDAWANYTPEHPTYHSQVEEVTGSGHVDWEDGVPAEGAQVQVQVRYIGLRAFQEDGAVPVDNPVTGWCDATVVYADVNGDFTWTLPFNLPCLPAGIEAGVMLPGWWQVRARASYPVNVADAPEETPGTSEAVLFYEDPNGLATGNLDLAGGSPP